MSMTKDDWMVRLEEVEEDLAVAEKSKVRCKAVDCDTLRRYVQWIKGKILKASVERKAVNNADNP